MTTALLERPQTEDPQTPAPQTLQAQAPPEKVIQTKYWKFAESDMSGWQPASVTILREDLEGPPAGPYTDGLDENLVMAFTGSRGSGKTQSLTYMIAKMMVGGYPAWTNYPISFFVKFAPPRNGGPCSWRADNRTEYFESMPLPINDFVTFSKQIRGGVVGITELQYFVEARTSGKVKNRLLGYQLMQIRKTDCSFFYDVQNPRWVDNRFGWSLDRQYECEDVARQATDEAVAMMRGAHIHWHYIDKSGSFLKHQGEFLDRLFHAHVCWGEKPIRDGMYPTKMLIDPMEAMSTVRLDLKEKVITNKADLGVLKSEVDEIIRSLQNDGIEEMSADDVWATFQDSQVNANKIQLGGLLRRAGVYQRRVNGETIYHLDRVNLP